MVGEREKNEGSIHSSCHVTLTRGRRVDGPARSKGAGRVLVSHSRSSREALSWSLTNSEAVERYVVVCSTKESGRRKMEEPPTTPSYDTIQGSEKSSMSDSLLTPLLVVKEEPMTTASNAVVGVGLHEHSAWTQFPARRTPPPPASGPPETALLIKTAGNALQAVSRTILDEDNLMAVTVPEGLGPGDNLYVVVPGTKIESRTIQAVVPPDAYAGHVFLVRIPKEGAAVSPPRLPLSPVAVVGENVSTPPSPDSHRGDELQSQVVPGHDVENTELRLQVEEEQGEEVEVEVEEEEEANMATIYPPQLPRPDAAAPSFGQLQLEADLPAESPLPQFANTVEIEESSLVLVKVPPGAAPGSKLHVRVDDGRLIEATVPEGNVPKFYLRVPAPQSNETPVESNNPEQQSNTNHDHGNDDQQTWHSHPVAVAPMVLPSLK